MNHQKKPRIGQIPHAEAMLHVLLTSTTIIMVPYPSIDRNPHIELFRSMTSSISIPNTRHHSDWSLHSNRCPLSPRHHSDRAKHCLARSGLKVLVVLQECVRNSRIVTRKVVTYVPYRTFSLSGFLAASRCHTMKII